MKEMDTRMDNLYMILGFAHAVVVVTNLTMMTVIIVRIVVKI